MTASHNPAPKPAPEPPATPPSPTPAAEKAPSLTKPVVAPAGTGPAQSAAEPSVGQLVNDASTHLSALIHGEIELAKFEIRSSVKNAGTGMGLFIGAAVILTFAVLFSFITLAEGITALGVARWLAFLIVFVLQLVIVGLFALFGYKKVKKVKAPERTIRTTKETVDYLKHHG